MHRRLARIATRACFGLDPPVRRRRKPQPTGEDRRALRRRHRHRHRRAPDGRGTARRPGRKLRRRQQSRAPRRVSAPNWWPKRRRMFTRCSSPPTPRIPPARICTRSSLRPDPRFCASGERIMQIPVILLVHPKSTVRSRWDSDQSRRRSRGKLSPRLQQTASAPGGGGVHQVGGINVIAASLQNAAGHHRPPGDGSPNTRPTWRRRNRRWWWASCAPWASPARSARQDFSRPAGENETPALAGFWNWWPGWRYSRRPARRRNHQPPPAEVGKSSPSPPSATHHWLSADSDADETPPTRRVLPGATGGSKRIKDAGIDRSDGLSRPSGGAVRSIDPLPSTTRMAVATTPPKRLVGDEQDRALFAVDVAHQFEHGASADTVSRLPVGSSAAPGPAAWPAHVRRPRVAAGRPTCYWPGCVAPG